MFMSSENEKIRRIISRKKVRSKEEFYVLYEAGVFGNKALTWNSYEDLKNSGWNGNVCLRSGRGVDRKRVDYNVKLEDVQKTIKSWEKDGRLESEIRYNQSMPDEHLVLQGEVIDAVGGFSLAYTTIKKPMIEAFEEQRVEIKGFNAKRILRTSMTGSSYSDLEDIFDLFPTAAIEFSTYNIGVGENPSGRNTVFWEVRDY